ncbi:hypothetical protein A6A06_01760 [Streptomyces sp. CB02923]|uniref:hypothetical protein n=1 Tax=Streptomyces sp. CB02923 TaxID=1718985 RepID=UPI000938C4C6|nr:hypothetical protein [Streptomyces sp. CB02923]OKI10232.1 hypothetical protein A6A06_01760 [Streptomyces sp. CB02923]
MRAEAGSPEVLPAETPADRFDAYLKRHGLARERVLEQVDDAFGEPLLVVAAGSVLAGFGNSTSDLDIYAVVPGEVASTLPLMSYAEDARIDVVLHGADRLGERHRTVVTGQWPPPDIGPGDLGSRRQLLDSLSRFGMGLPLSGVPKWCDWQALLDGQLTGWLRTWYAVEAVRKRTAARALAGRKPVLAALRAGEALTAALERHAVDQGERYFKGKWLGEKLRRLGDDRGLAAFRLAMCPPPTAEAVPSYLARVGDLLDDYLRDIGTAPWRAHLKPAAGTAWSGFGTTALVSRWGLRVAAVDAGGPAAHETSWDYALDEPWPPDVEKLFAEDMLWLGLRSAS